MDIQLYICEGEVEENSKVYLPDFTHHAHHDLSYPEKWFTLQELKEQGYKIAKQIDFTPRYNVEDKSKPIQRYIILLVRE